MKGVEIARDTPVLYLFTAVFLSDQYVKKIHFLVNIKNVD